MKNFNNFKKEQQYDMMGDYGAVGPMEDESMALDMMGDYGRQGAGMFGGMVGREQGGLFGGMNQMDGLFKFLQGFNNNQPMPNQGQPPSWMQQRGNINPPLPRMPDRQLNIPRIEDNIYEG